MSWAIITSKYSRSILENEQPLLLLALIERNGMATENELAAASKLDMIKVKKALLDLQLNRLIEYGSHHVRLTEGGKFLIDRFDLNTSIVDDFLDTLRLSIKERKDYRELVYKFRSDAYPIYQNSLCSVRIWSDVARRVPSESDSDEYRDDIAAGMKSLFLRDIRNWLRHSYLSLPLSPAHNPDFKVAFSKDGVSSFEVESNQISRVLLYLHALEKPEETSSHKAIKDHQLVNLIVTYQYLQAASEPYRWFDNWCEAAPNLPNEHRFKIASNYVVKVKKVLEQVMGKPIHKREMDLSDDLYLESWAPSNFPTRPKNDLLTAMFTSSSIDQLTQQTGLAEQSLVDSLNTIMRRCKFLLDSTENPKTTAGEH